MKTVVVPETRRALEIAFNSRCIKENTPLLDRLSALRHEFATLVGYQNYAQYETEVLMSKTAVRVKDVCLASDLLILPG